MSVAVKSIEFARRGRCVCHCVYLCFFIMILCSNFLVNCADRVLRVYDLEQVMGETEEDNSADEVEALQRLQDLVNR